MKTKAILSVVFRKAGRDLDHFDYDKKKWIEKGPPIPVNEYIGSGGHSTSDLQKAQIFGFSTSARKKLHDYYKDPRLFDVRPVIIQLA
jgi:hypothetical protein